MTEPNLPDNQIDALPIRTVQAAAQGDAIVIGNTLTRYWSSAVLNFPAIFDANALARSAVIDVTGCDVFTLIMSRTILVVGGDVANTYTAFVLYQASDGTDEWWTTTSGNQRMARNCVIGGALGVPYPRTDVFTFAWSSNVLQGAGAGGGMVTIGRRIRIGLSGGGINPAQQSYAFEMWGSQG